MVYFVIYCKFENLYLWGNCPVSLTVMNPIRLSQPIIVVDLGWRRQATNPYKKFKKNKLKPLFTAKKKIAGEEFEKINFGGNIPVRRISQHLNRHIRNTNTVCFFVIFFGSFKVSQNTKNSHSSKINPHHFFQKQLKKNHLNKFCFAQFTHKSPLSLFFLNITAYH